MNCAGSRPTCAKRMLVAQQKATELAGRTFNLDSPKQLGALLFEELKLPVMVKTPSGPAFDQRGGAGGDRRPARAAARDPGISRPGQTAQHLYRQAAGNGQSRHRPRAHQLPPGRCRDRAAVLLRSQPAEHPDPHRRRPPHPPGLRRAAGSQDRGLRLLADRAADHGPPVRRPGPDAAPSNPAWTCTRPRRPKCSAASSTKSPATNAARPRRSTSA